MSKRLPMAMLTGSKLPRQRLNKISLSRRKPRGPKLKTPPRRSKPKNKRRKRWPPRIKPPKTQLQLKLLLRRNKRMQSKM